MAARTWDHHISCTHNFVFASFLRNTLSPSSLNERVLVCYVFLSRVRSGCEEDTTELRMTWFILGFQDVDDDVRVEEFVALESIVRFALQQFHADIIHAGGHRRLLFTNRALYKHTRTTTATTTRRPASADRTARAANFRRDLQAT